jgi:hypothetical protein
VAFNTSSYWPDVSDQQKAEKAIGYGFGAAAFVACITGGLALVAMYLHKPILGIDGLGLVDAVMFAAIGFGINKKSRAAAVIGLGLYAVERIYMMVQGSGDNSAGAVASVLFTLYFIHGVRGTFAYRRLSKQAAIAAGAPL